ncbi:MAG TPA: hypothetical protein PK294_00350 [Ignavibacteria bacterium]|nr:hypothetical protein [Ignavibacteria bacterium]HQY53481.1 hypothetical protein [Ignavibacteria bacterium]HRA98859.1 hypothetical protein [Ignavibacteria bacterium]
MKKIIFILILISQLIIINESSAQIPQYTLEAKNFNLVSPYLLKFDLVFTHTDATVMQLAGWTFFLRGPQSLGTFYAGFGSASSFMLDTANGVPVSDLPESFRPRNTNTIIASNSPGNYEFRAAANSLPGCGGGLIMQQGVPILIGRYNLKSSTPINLSALDTNPIIFRDSCESPLSATRTKINWYDANGCLNKEMTRCSNHFINMNPVFVNVNLNLKISIEGLYNVSNDKLFKKETATVYLRKSTSPYQVVDSASAIIDSVNLTGNFDFQNISLFSNYYIVVKTKNGLETWSKSGGVTLAEGNNFYDFTSSVSQAYGSNMVLKGSRGCIYSGNVNNDQIIDSDDLVMIDNDLFNYTLGNAVTNLNGDIIVDIDDLAIADRNAAQLILVNWPGLAFDKRKELEKKSIFKNQKIFVKN